ncbi:MAG: hypothetical protein M1833_005131 [Piccolia ochrophora]|nr:MAG: hypothetical protein M1833_005131 [Piccolia ochrophora]
MDSMRSLNTSLPTSPSKARPYDPPEDLLQAFKSAALSVTNLYKTAASDQSQARQAGYQDALEHLVNFLDKEQLGLKDGEGRKIRRWAAERYERSGHSQAPQNGVESEDEKVDGDRVRPTSPVEHRRESPTDPSSHLSTRSPSPLPSLQDQPHIVHASDAFTFRSQVSFPHHSDSDMDIAPQDGTPSTHGANQGATQHANVSTPSVRLEVVPKVTRNRHNGNAGRLSNRSTNTHGLLGTGAGAKRRLPFGEFFDIGSGNGKDSFGSGPKKGRYL